MPSAWTDNNRRGTVSARSKLACCASSRETASAVVRSHVPRESRVILGDRSWHVAARPRAEGERPLTGAAPLLGAWIDHKQRGTARTQQKACVLRLLSRDSERSGAPARATQYRMILGGHHWHVALRPYAELEVPLAGAALLPSGWTDKNRRSTVRARSKLACCTSCRETASAVARPRVPHESRLVMGGYRWHVAPRPRAEEERPLASAVPLPSARVDHNQRCTARAAAESSRAAPPPERQQTQWPPRVPRESQLILGGHRWHVAAQPPAEGERPLAGAASFPSAWTDQSRGCTARAQHQARVLRLLPRDNKRSGHRACHAKAG